MTSQTQAAARLYFIDWIRVIAFGLLILFHCTMPFVTFGWEIKNQEQSLFLSRIIIWLHQWRLPLLFFVSGVGTNFSLTSRGAFRFLGERFVRLFIPLAFAMMFTIPLQVYFEWRQTGRISVSYFDFYPSVWDFIPYPDGSLTWSHMWFVVYLFVFTVLLWPLLSIMKINVIQKAINKLQPLFTNPLVIASIAGLFIFYYIKLYIKWPEQQNLIADWFNFVFSVTLFFFGFFLTHFNKFWEVCEHHRWYFLSGAAICAWVLIIKFYWPLQLPEEQNELFYVYAICDAIQIWFLIIAAIGFARKHLNFTNGFLKYTTEAVYPFYILHQTIIVVAGYYIVQWPLPIIAKLLILIFICFISVYMLYEYLIKRTKITRLLYGLKLRKTTP
jgi:glucans biosynthesis protein C